MNTIDMNSRSMNVPDFIEFLGNLPKESMIFLDSVESMQFRDPIKYAARQSAPNGVLYCSPVKEVIGDCVTYNIRIQSNYYKNKSW